MLLGGVVLLLGVLLMLFFSRYERTVEIKKLPPMGEAAYNPLYALRQILRAEGQPAQSRQRLQLDTVSLAKRDTVLVYSDPRMLMPQELSGLFAFAETGGHLILRLPAWDASNKEGNDSNAVLAEWLPLEAELLQPGCVHLQVSGQLEHVEFCKGPRFSLREDSQPLLIWGDDNGGYAYARFAYGEGSVDLLADMEMLQSDALRERTHVLFVRQLFVPNWGQGTVHLVYAANMPPLWRWLLSHAWMMLLPCVLALLAWMWQRTQRFGPYMPSPQQPRRALMEHLEASGEHLLRYGQLARMHLALREAVLIRLRRRDPLAAEQDDDIRAQLLARRTGISAADLRATLDSRSPHHLAEFRHRISCLIDLRKRL